MAISASCTRFRFLGLSCVIKCWLEVGFGICFLDIETPLQNRQNANVRVELAHDISMGTCSP